MTDKKTTTRRTEADIRARDRADIAGLKAVYGPKGDKKVGNGKTTNKKK